MIGVMSLKPGLSVGRIRLSLALLVGLACGGQIVPASAQQQPATRPGGPSIAKWTPEQKEQYRWEQLIEFFGDEATDAWSLRIRDVNANERATFKYLELWKLDLKDKKWVKIDDEVREAQIVPASEKPADSVYPDTQMLAELPLKGDDLGLYFAKWRVNNRTDGATFTRLGPGTVTKQVTTLPTKLPVGWMLTVVPLDRNTAERQLVPDPRYHTGQTGRPALPTTQPRR